MQSTPRSVSVLPLEKYKIQQRDTYASPNSSAGASTSTRHQPNEYPFELLEKLQLTRDEWVQYFKDRTLTPSATLQLQELLQQRYIVRNKIQKSEEINLSSKSKFTIIDLDNI